MFLGDVGRLYIWWMGVWASMHRGYWFVASLYLVLDAHLSAFQLVTIGVVQSVVSGLFEVPAGVVADTFSRKWSLVFAHLLMGGAIVFTGSVTSFGALVASASSQKFLSHRSSPNRSPSWVVQRVDVTRTSDSVH